MLILIILIIWSIPIIFFGKAKIIIGTISAKTMISKKALEKMGYEVIHSDQFRDQGLDYKKAGFKALRKFLLKFFLFKKVAMFTSNPTFLTLKCLNILTISVKVKDRRVTRLKNLLWASGLKILEILEFLPKYFNQDVIFEYKEILGVQDRSKEADKRISVFIKELRGYPDNRFLKEKNRFDFGYLGTIINQH